MADTVNYNEIRRGLNVELDGDAYQIVDFKHVYMQQRAPTLTLKVRQLRSGKVFERNLPGSQRLTVAEVEQTEAQYLYNDGDSYVFMDTETFDQFPPHAGPDRRPVQVPERGREHHDRRLQG